MIRDAQKDDLPQLLDLLERCFKEMGFAGRGHSWDRDSCCATLTSVWATDGVFIVSDDLSGVFAAYNVPSLTDYTNRKMVEIAFHTDPNLPRITRTKLSQILLSSAIIACKEKGAKSLSIAASVTPPNASRFFIKNGFTPDEILFLKEL